MLMNKKKTQIYYYISWKGVIECMIGIPFQNDNNIIPSSGFTWKPFIPLGHWNRLYYYLYTIMQHRIVDSISRLS
jgi:hypothetical protein